MTDNRPPDRQDAEGGRTPPPSQPLPSPPQPPSELPKKQVENLNLGTIAVDMGFCTPDQVETCVRLQHEMQGMGVVPKKIGELLLEKGYLRNEQLEETLRQQVHRGVPVQITGYRFVSKIGQGAMGAIYKAVQLSMDRPVAVKILSPRYAEDTRFVERFFREARAVARLNHPNIIQGIDVGEVGGIHYFVMEFVDGRTIGELLRRGGALDERRAVYVILQVVRALAHAWKNGLLHRDLKPDNIMIARDGIAKLCDLGLAKNIGAILNAQGAVIGQIEGTPHYISPEQARGDAAIDMRSDIYGLGATFYHMVVGQVPFPFDNASVVLTKHLTEMPDPPRARNSLVSAPVENVILRMMAKEREQRYQSPEDLMAALESVRSEPGTPVASTPIAGAQTTPRTSAPAIRRKPGRRWRHT
jgi:serine/threonine protein kinase